MIFLSQKVVTFFHRDLSREFEIPISSFSPSAHEIHFQKEFFEGNMPFIPPNIMGTKCEH